MLLELWALKRAREAEDAASAALTLLQEEPLTESEINRLRRRSHDKFAGWCILLSFLAWMIFG